MGMGMRAISSSPSPRPAQTLGAHPGGLPLAHDADAERRRAHGLDHRQVVDARVMNQRDDPQIGMLPAQLVSCVPIGRRRMRLPVAAARALASAGANGGTGGSPIPVGTLAEGTICTSTRGMSAMRSGS